MENLYLENTGCFFFGDFFSPIHFDHVLTYLLRTTYTENTNKKTDLEEIK